MLRQRLPAAAAAAMHAQLAGGGSTLHAAVATAWAASQAASQVELFGALKSFAAASGTMLSPGLNRFVVRKNVSDLLFVLWGQCVPDVWFDHYF